MARELSYTIKAKMAGVASAITETFKNMRPVQIPVESSDKGSKIKGEFSQMWSSLLESAQGKAPAAAQKAFSKTKEATENIQKRMTEFSKTFQTKFQTMFEGAMKKYPNITKEVYRRSQEAGQGVKDMFARFGAELDSSQSMGDALYAFKNLGDGVVKTITGTFAPFGKWILLFGGISVVVGKAIADIAVRIGKFIAQYSQYAAEMEQTQMRFKRAFSRGGRSQGASTGRFERAAQDVASDGLYSEQSAMEALGNIRASNPYLSSDELEKSLKLGKELASLTGGDLVGSTEKVASVLHSESVDMQSLIDLGVVLNQTEWAHLQSLDTAATRLQRNQMIMAKIAEANKGGAEEFGSTIQGQWQKFTSMLDSIKLSIGKIVAPIMRVVMDIVNPIMEIGKELFSYFEDSIGSVIDLIANNLSLVIKPIGATLVGFTKVLVNISKILFGPIIQVIKFISSLFKSSGNETTKRIKQYYDFINKILVGFQRLQQALSNGIFKLFKSGYSSYVKPFVDGTSKAFKKLGNVISSFFKKFRSAWSNAFKKADKMTGGWLSKITSGFSKYFKKIGKRIAKVFTDEKEKAKKQDKKEKDYVDPRAKLSVNFEDASSMTNRIQKSILERQSPQVKMVDLLTKINEKVDEIGNGQKKTAGINEQQVNETRVTNTTLRKQNVGLQYG